MLVCTLGSTSGEGLHAFSNGKIVDNSIDEAYKAGLCPESIQCNYANQTIVLRGIDDGCVEFQSGFQAKTGRLAGWWKQC